MTILSGRPDIIIAGKQFYDAYRRSVCKQVYRSGGRSKDRRKRVKWVLKRR